MLGKAEKNQRPNDIETFQRNFIIASYMNDRCSTPFVSGRQGWRVTCRMDRSSSSKHPRLLPTVRSEMNSQPHTHASEQEEACVVGTALIRKSPQSKGWNREMHWIRQAGRLCLIDNPKKKKKTDLELTKKEKRRRDIALRIVEGCLLML